MLTGWLAADVNGAEVQDHMAAGSRPTKAQHRTEPREKQHLIEVMADRRRIGTLNNVVSGHLAIGIHSDVDQQIMLQLQIGMLHFGDNRFGIIGKGDEFRRPQ